MFGLHKGLAAWIFSYFDFTFEHQKSCAPKGPRVSYQKPQRFQKFLVRHFILRHSSPCELRYCWTTFVPLTAVLWEIGAIPTQTWPQIRISCWRAILVWKLMQRFTTILALPLEIQTLANLKHWQKLLYSKTHMYTCIWFYDCICTYVCVFCFIFGCFNQLLSLELATSINIHWFNHCTPMFLNETFTANCNGLPFWGYIFIYYQCWAGTVEQWLFFARCPPLKRLALTSPTISSSRSPWSSISSATQPHWRTVANLLWSSKNTRLWRTNTGVFRPRWPAWVQFWRGLMENGRVTVCDGWKKSWDCNFFSVWILFWLISEADCFYWILTGCWLISWNDMSWTEYVIWKKGTIFWFPKIFTVPKNHGASRRGGSGGEGSLRFHWDHHWLDQFFARWNQGTLPKRVKKGGRKLDFPVGCLFFLAKSPCCPQDLEETRWKNDF